MSETHTIFLRYLFHNVTTDPALLQFMARAFHLLWSALLSLSLSLYLIPSICSSDDQVYIVYLGHNQKKHPLVTTDRHIQLLSNVFESEQDSKQAMLYSYKHGFSGFSAAMNSKQAKALACSKGVISVFKSKTLNLHTTRSWDFLGLNIDYVERSPSCCGSDVIVGIIDSGIWPESPSFREEPGMRPIPKSWKGKCVGGESFNAARACNRKLIGAKYYIAGFESRYGSLNQTGYKEYRSPYDAVGHGTHTASIAAGSVVRAGASFYGFAAGTARGGAPRSARLAVYKACWNLRFSAKCSEADILAAFDDALHDGVGVISASFGRSPPLRLFFRSAADIGSFHAMQMGASVVFAAGNDGPAPSSVGNVAPWSISVAASTIDRTFPTHISVDAGKLSLLGQGFVVSKITGSLVNATYAFTGGICHQKYIKETRPSAKGKVMLCFSNFGPTIFDADLAVNMIGASGLIFVESLSRMDPSVTISPSVQIDIIQGQKLQNYLDLADPPTSPICVEIFPSKTLLQASPAPIVADFSSRGPSCLSPDFLKPDLTAPGVNILAAWPPTTPPGGIPDDKRVVNWNLLSGTSMSCPHVAGVIALLRSVHPDWSPAVIRSALMTTAYNTDTTGDQILAAGTIKPSDPFDVGSGHISPIRAMDPGLVYDMKTLDYVTFLCNIGYTWDQIKILVFQLENMMPSSPPRSNADLNYPSITVMNLGRTTTITRRVRNVGSGPVSVYFVKVVSPNGVNVAVWPKVLIFTPFNQEAAYYVTLVPTKKSQARFDFGEIVWSDGSHFVRSPLVVNVETATTGSEEGPFAYIS